MPDNRGNDIGGIVAQAEQAAREGAYVAVGLGVLAFQRAQVRRRELAKRLAEGRQPGEPARDREPAGDLGGGADRPRPTGERLAGPFAEAMRSAGVNVDATRAQLRELARTADEWALPARRAVDRQLDAIGKTLPPGGRVLFWAVRSAAAASEARLRAAAGLAS